MLSFLILYVSGIIFEGHCKEHPEQIHTPQFRQWQGRLKTANLASQMKHTGLSENGSIRGGAQALARASACAFVGTENARSAFDASVILLLSRAFWFVFTVATHIPVVSLGNTDQGSNVRGRTEPAASRFKPPPPRRLLFPSIPNRRSMTLFVVLNTRVLPRATLDTYASKI